LQNLQIDCVIDVGANEGQFALSLRELGYKGRIYSFEPVPSIYAILVSNSAGDPNWEVLNFGLSSLNQEKEFYIYKDTSLSSISEINAVGRDVAGKLSELVGKERVLLRTLDNWLTELNSFEAIFLKTDTQGHDLEVLRGGFEVLKRTAVALIEAPVQKIYTASFDPSEAAALMAEAALFPSRAFPISVDDNFCVIELDQFFIRQEP
jgi:FkbM family methyltransferase